MNYCLAQLVLAARNDDVDGWMNTLVIVLLAVFWAIGGILKARARKTEAEAEEEEKEGEELFKPKPSTRGAAVQRPPQPQRIQADARKLKARQAELSIRERKAQESKAAAAKMTKPKKPVSAPEELAIEPLLSAEEPDELKKAILHYEILGKPLSLREPADEGAF